MECLSTTVIHKPLPRGKGFESTSEREALLWLNSAIGISIDTQLWNYDTNVYNETIRLTVMYYEANISNQYN